LSENGRFDSFFSWVFAMRSISSRLSRFLQA
jgi:hypothetical protein